MMRFAEAVKLLSAPFPVQDVFLRDVPETTAERDFNACNDIYRMAVLFLESGGVSEGDGGSEGVECWRMRTQIPPDIMIPTQWLATAVRMLIELRKPFLFTRHGLRSAHEWKLIRYLAGQVCDEMGWSTQLDYPNFETLWSELGNGVLDEQIEQARWQFKSSSARA